MKERDICEITCVDDEKTVRVQPLIEKANIFDVTKLFKALSDETRMKIAYALTLEDELCVCDVANHCWCHDSNSFPPFASFKKLRAGKIPERGEACVLFP